MKNTIFPAILMLSLCALGCGLLDQSKTGADNRAPVVFSPAPAPTATPTATPAASPSPTPFDKASLGTNLFAFGAGTVVVAKTSEFHEGRGAADKLIDESGSDEGWRTESGDYADQSVTLELPARTTLDKIVFDTETDGATNKTVPKNVRVEMSDESPTSGFQTILEATLKDQPSSDSDQGADNQILALDKKIAGRFVRYTVISNYGSTDHIFTKEMSGYGTQEQFVQPNISGTYQMFGGALVHLKQEGAAVIGCNAQLDVIYEGAISGRTLIYQRRDPGKEPEGLGIYNFSPDNQKVESLWYPNGKESFAMGKTGTKISDKIGNCASLPDLDGAKDVAKDNLERELEANGKAILYGINFDFNSDAVKPESRPTLDKVIAILKDKPDWKFSIEGHTDNVGGAAFNQTLSEKRAAAVVKYLTDAKIAADRLTSKGYGLSRPVAPNNSEVERAQNRRVELLKQ